MSVPADESPSWQPGWQNNLAGLLRACGELRRRRGGPTIGVGLVLLCLAGCAADPGSCTTETGEWIEKCHQFRAVHFDCLGSATTQTTYYDAAREVCVTSTRKEYTP